MSSKKSLSSAKMSARSNIPDKVYSIVIDALNDAYPDLPPHTTGMWEVIDAEWKNDEPVLALVHYNEGSGFEQYPSVMRLRGTVVDLKSKKVIVESHGYTHHIATDDPLSVSNGSLLVNTLVPGSADKKLLAFPLEKVRVRPLQEGVMLRVFKFNDKVYVSNYKKLNCSKSKWQGSETFLQMFIRIYGGKEKFDKLVEELFSTDDKKYYVFFVSAAGVKIVSTVKDEHVCLVSVGMSDEKVELKESVIGYQGLITDIEMMNAILFPGLEIKKDWYKIDEELAEGEMKFAVDNKGLLTGIQTNPYTFAGGDCLLVEEVGGTVWAIRPSGFRKREDLAGAEPNFYNSFVRNVRSLTLTYGADAFDFSSYPWPRLSDRELSKDVPFDRLVAYSILLHTVINPVHRDEIMSFPYRISTDIHILCSFIALGRWKRVEVEKAYGIFKLTSKSCQRIESLVVEAVRSKDISARLRSMLFRETGTSLQKLLTTVRHYIMCFDDEEMDNVIRTLPEHDISRAQWIGVLEKKAEFAKTHPLQKL